MLLGGSGQGLIFDDFDFSIAAGFTGGEYILFENVDSYAGDVLTAGQTTGFINGFEAELFLDGNNLMLTVIPEPGTVAAILGALALGLAGWRRRQSRRFKMESGEAAGR